MIYFESRVVEFRGQRVTSNHQGDSHSNLAVQILYFFSDFMCTKSDPYKEVRRKLVIVGDHGSGALLLLHDLRTISGLILCMQGKHVYSPDLHMEECRGYVHKEHRVFLHKNRPHASKDYIPSIFESYVADMTIDNKPFELALWDTAGQPEHDRLRPLSYGGSSVILTTFSIEQTDSLAHVEQKWFPEILHFCSKPAVPYLLIGCKKDLRNDQRTVELLKTTGQRFVTEEEGEAVAKKIGALAYMECSAETGDGVTEVFERAVRESKYLRFPRSHKTCLIF
jgi:Ras homolog gene family, member A